MNTLKDVIDRLKVEGMLTRNSGTHSIKSMKELLTQNIEASLEISSQLKEMGAVVPQLAQSEGDTNKGDALEAWRFINVGKRSHVSFLTLVHHLCFDERCTALPSFDHSCVTALRHAA